MFSCYDISFIRNDHTGETAHVRFFEGDFFDVEYEGEIVREFQRTKILDEIDIKFLFTPLGSDFQDICRDYLAELSKEPLLNE